jgi:Fur family ferric uptake transcriptional regulator
VARNRIEELCASRGLRLTTQRRVIARVLAAAGDHPDIEELHRRALAFDPGIAVSTVYRTMKRFEDEGIIEKHAFNDGRSRYERQPEQHHDHLIDVTTGKVIEFSSEEIERLQASIAERLGYRLVGHRLELYAEPLPESER